MLRDWALGCLAFVGFFGCFVVMLWVASVTYTGVPEHYWHYEKILLSAPLFIVGGAVIIVLTIKRWLGK